MSLAAQFPRFVLLVTQTLGPEISRRAGTAVKSEIKEIFYSSTILINAISIPAAIVSMTASREFFSLWLGPERSSYWVMFVICAVWSMSRAAQSSSYHTLMSAGNIMVMSTTYLISSILGVIACFVALKLGYGIQISICCLLCFDLLRNLFLMPAITCRQFSIPLSRLYINGYIVPIASCLASCAFVSFVDAFLKYNHNMATLFIYGILSYAFSVLITIIIINYMSVLSLKIYLKADV
jgi:O-antigen/teichoic acid export membrane protein